MRQKRFHSKYTCLCPKRRSCSKRVRTCFFSASTQLSKKTRKPRHKRIPPHHRRSRPPPPQHHTTKKRDQNRRTFPSSMRSGIPPASAPTTGTPLAMDSSTTKPSVSVSDGMTKTSAEANAWLRASPVIWPVSTVLVLLKCSFRASESGPPPTNASLAFGILQGGKEEALRWKGRGDRAMVGGGGGGGAAVDCGARYY